MKAPETPAELECVRDGARAGVLLHPTRLAILDRARQPRSATEIGAELDLTRQKVNYHVRELERAGFLRRAGRRKKRNLYEQRWIATAHGYVLSPELLGPLGADRRRVEDELSAAHLLGLGARMQRELGQAVGQAAAAGQRLSTLSVDAELRFESAEQRERFAVALRDAVARVVAEHASPSVDPDGAARAGRPYRLLVGCHPIPPRDDEATPGVKGARDETDA